MATATSYSDYLAKLKELRATLKKGEDSGYLRLRIGGEYFVFPYAVGLQVLAAMDQAEKTNAPYAYSEPPRIHRLGADNLEIAILSRAEYEDIHMAQLLQLKLSEVQDLRQSKGDPLPF